MDSIRPQTVTLAVLAIMFGLGAAWFAKQILTRQQPPVEQVVVPPPVEPMATLLIMQANLPKDSRLRDQDVAPMNETVAHLKERHVPDNAFKFKQQASGRILKVVKRGGEWLTEEDFYPIGMGPITRVKPGFRDMTLRVDDPAVASSGLIHAGDLVDVIYTGDNPDDNSPIAQRLCSGLEVISPPVSEGGLRNPIITVSGKSYVHLAVTPAQVKQLQLAQSLSGTISITLSATPGGEGALPMESQGSEFAAVSISEIPLTERELLHLPPPAKPPAPPDRIVIEEIRGNKFGYAIFTQNNERLSEEEARQDSLPASSAPGAAPAAKKCKTCGKPIKGHGAASPGSSPAPTPAPQATPTPAPAAST